MDYKEKYNKLVESIKKLQEANPSDEGIQNWVNDNVPELRESEDERIRKCLLRFHKSTIDIDGIKGDEIVSWLEKQGQQSSWSEEDEEKFRDVIRLVEQGAPVQSIRDHYTSWLKSLKQRYTWKPTDGQIKALKDACDKSWEPDGLDPLYTLYKNLEKLKGE